MPSFKPKCPNHAVPLEIDAKSRRSGKGAGVCPQSGAIFQFEADTKNPKKDKFGNLTYNLTVHGND